MAVRETVTKENETMAKIIDDEFYVCSDCLMIIANDDASSLDYYYEDKADAREQEIRDAIDAVDGTICAGDSDRDLEFSRNGCECCGSRLAGTLHHCVVLTP
jgi:hypothetical protein